MNKRDYRTLTNAILGTGGCPARTLRELRNRTMILPKGSEVKIMRKFGGFEIEGPKCECCGVQVRMTKVDPEYLGLLALE